MLWMPPDTLAQHGSSAASVGWRRVVTPLVSHFPPEKFFLSEALVSKQHRQSQRQEGACSCLKYAAHLKGFSFSFLFAFCYSDNHTGLFDAVVRLLFCRLISGRKTIASQKAFIVASAFLTMDLYLVQVHFENGWSHFTHTIPQGEVPLPLCPRRNIQVQPAYTLMFPQRLPVSSPPPHTHCADSY